MPTSKSPKEPGRDRPGLPSPETVVSETTFVSPKGRTYRVLRTNQKDPYDPPDDEPGGETGADEKPARRKGARRRKREGEG